MSSWDINTIFDKQGLHPESILAIRFPFPFSWSLVGFFVVEAFCLVLVFALLSSPEAKARQRHDEDKVNVLSVCFRPSYIIIPKYAKN